MSFSQYDLAPFKEFIEVFGKRRIHTVESIVKWANKRMRLAVAKTRFFDLLIIGGQGMGKSTLALYLLYKYYKDPEEVLANTFFVEDHLMSTLLNERREVILFDDAGVTLNKWRAMSQKSVEYNIFQQIIRTMASSIIYTTVFDNIVKFVRDTVKSYIALHTLKDLKDGTTVVYGSLYENKIKTRLIRIKRADFAMNIDELHDDPDFHYLYVKYSKAREDFIRNMVEQILERRGKPQPPEPQLPSRNQEGPEKASRAKEVRRFIEQVVDEKGEVEIAELVKRAVEKGFERELVLEQLRKLIASGEYYEPRPGKTIAKI